MPSQGASWSNSQSDKIWRAGGAFEQHLHPSPFCGEVRHPIHDKCDLQKRISAPLSYSQVFCTLPVLQDAQWCWFLLFQVALHEETNPSPAACTAGAPVCFPFLDQRIPAHPSSSSDHFPIICLCLFLSCLLHTWFIPDFLKCSGQTWERCYSSGAFPSLRLGPQGMGPERN